MRLVIDLQSLQTPGRHFSQGRQSLELARAMAAQSGDHETWLAFNAGLPFDFNAIQRAFSSCLPPGRMALFDAPRVNLSPPERRPWVAAASARIRESWLEGRGADFVLAPDALALTPEGLLAAPLARGNCGLLREAMPFFADRFLRCKDSHLQASREAQMERLRGSPVLFAGTAHLRSRAMEFWDGRAPVIQVIHAGASACFDSSAEMDVDSEKQLLERLGIIRRFVLVPAGHEPAENVTLLLNAFARLPREIRDSLHLVVAGQAGDDARHIWEEKMTVSGLLPAEVVMTGYVSDLALSALYRRCEVFVTASLRETFPLAVVEAMRSGAAVLAGDHAGFAEVIANKNALFNPHSPEQVTRMLRDALDDAGYRRALKAHSRLRAGEYTWERTARLAWAALEEAHARQEPRAVIVQGAAAAREKRLVSEIAQIVSTVQPHHDDLARVSTSIVNNRAPDGTVCLYLDITGMVDGSYIIGGVHRVARALVRALMETPPAGYRVEPVYLSGDDYRHARRETLRLLNLPEAAVEDAPVAFQAGDVFVGLNLLPDVIRRRESWFHLQKARGMRIYFVVYDLLPVHFPHFFPFLPPPMFEDWLATISRVSDGLVAISRTVAEEMRAWLDATRLQRHGPLRLGYFHLGSDVMNSVPLKDGGTVATEEMICLESRPSFLMVSTLEPRKQHALALAAFDVLWEAGDDVCLVIVGKKGWLVDDLARRLREHPEHGRRLFWYEAASDDVLMALYAGCSALLVPSVGEGFGLPLVEAAQHGLPILARDLPVFREVAGDHAAYFSGEGVDDLAQAVRRWLVLREEGRAPASRGIPSLTWAESARQLTAAMLDGRWHCEWRGAAGE
jgi:glycosyltransferase involved in cell wall biosynthesis